MSIRQQIEALEELAGIDVDIRRIEEELAKQKGALDGLRADLQSLETRVGLDRERLVGLERTRSELHVELRQMVQQVERSREKMQRSRNEREANAAQRELEELRKLQRDREDEITKLTSLADALRVTIDETEAKRVALSQELEGTQEGATTSIADLEREHTARAEGRVSAVAKLPPVIYRRYETIRTRRPYAIAKTHDGTCLGCHIGIPPMMFQKMLRQEELEQCPNCRRLLYYVPPARAEDASASTTRNA